MGERVIVVGAGLVGMSCAVALAEAGRHVDVLARDLPGETASTAGPALCLPPPPGLGPRGRGWWQAARDRLEADAAAGAASGVTVRRGRSVRATSGPASAGVDVGAGEEPAVPVLEAGTYLRWLTARLLGAGGTVTRMSLTALPRTADPVVNCTGVAARALAADPLVRPRAHRLLRVDAGTGSWTAVLAADGRRVGQLVPDGDSTVLDGAVGTDGVPEDDEDLLAWVARFEPAVAGARVLAARTVVHAGRDQVRLDAVSGPAGPVVHCYGLGSAAAGLAPGCAADVVALVTGTATSTAP